MFYLDESHDQPGWNKYFSVSGLEDKENSISWLEDQFLMFSSNKIYWLKDLSYERYFFSRPGSCCPSSFRSRLLWLLLEVLFSPRIMSNGSCNSVFPCIVSWHSIWYFIRCLGYLGMFMNAKISYRAYANNGNGADTYFPFYWWNIF